MLISTRLIYLKHKSCGKHFFLSCKFVFDHNEPINSFNVIKRLDKSKDKELSFRVFLPIHWPIYCLFKKRLLYFVLKLMIGYYLIDL